MQMQKTSSQLGSSIIITWKLDKQVQICIQQNFNILNNGGK
jgi:hypothetical protein